MRLSFTSTAAALLASASLAVAHGWDLSHEHHGDFFGRAHQSACGDGVLHNGNSTGVTRTVDGESLYLAYPPGRRPKTDTAILYFTDIFGNALVNNRLLADSIAKAGYFVVMPDLFRGDAVPADAMSDPNSTFNMTEWRARHPQDQIESIIDSAINSTRTQFGAEKLGAVGYCFGGRYVALYLAEGRGLDAGFAAHPSGTMVDEWEAVVNPMSIAFGALDDLNTPENRSTIEGIFQDTNRTYQTSLYAGAAHGFAVRANLTDKLQAFAQESAYFQAVRWLDSWVKDED